MIATRADRLVARPVAWRWRRRLPRGKLVILAGDPGLGKSYLVTDVHARESTGAAWPDEAVPRAPIHSIILSAEDGAEDTIKLRLDGQGAEGSRIHVVQAIMTRQGAQTIVSLDRDLPHLEELVTATSAGLVSIDPINAYLPVRDSYKDSDIRQALAPLALFAERTGVTLVLVMHLTKDTDRQALYRILGGVGYTAAVRVVLLVAKDPREPGRKYVVSPKNNLAPKAAPLAFAIEERPKDRGELVWESELVAGLDVEAVVRGVLPDQAELKEPGAREAARDFLREMLGDGTQWAADVLKAAHANGIARRTLFKARHDLHLRAGKVGQPDSSEQAWYWWLPGTKDVRPKSAAPWERRRVPSPAPQGTLRTTKRKKRHKTR
jgi:AAA domain